ncbi:MAG: hypothetical protein ACLSCV_12480 [Acutalibacteraceae bacterium]
MLKQILPTHGAGIRERFHIYKDSDVVQSLHRVWGMYGDKGISISDSVVTAASTSSNYYSGMFSSSGNITIESSTVVASSANDAGIMTNGDTITNSDVDATTEFPGGDDFGIFAIGNNVSISGGTVKATAIGKYANAIYASEVRFQLKRRRSICKAARLPTLLCMEQTELQFRTAR